MGYFLKVARFSEVLDSSLEKTDTGSNIPTWFVYGWATGGLTALLVFLGLERVIFLLGGRGTYEKILDIADDAGTNTRHIVEQYLHL